MCTRKDIRNNRLGFDGCLKTIFLVSTKLLWAEKSFYPLGMCSVCQNGNKISRPWYRGTEGRSEEHVGRCKVMTEPVMSETCSQASIQEFQTVPSSGYRSYRNPFDFLFLLPCYKWLAIPAPGMLPYWWPNRWPPKPQPNQIIVWGTVALDECMNIFRCTVSVGLAMPFPLYFPICNNTLLMMCWFLPPYTT